MTAVDVLGTGDELADKDGRPGRRRHWDGHRSISEIPAKEADAAAYVMVDIDIHDAAGTHHLTEVKGVAMAIQTADVIMPGNDNAFETGRRGQISSIAELDESYRWLLEKNVTATLATMKRNGLPQLTPIWVAHDGTHILVNTKKGRLKDRNMRARSDVAILCVNPANPYHWMAINGKVVETIEETDPVKGREATDNVNEMAHRYINTTPYPLRDPKGEERVLFKVRPTYVMTFGPPPSS